MCPDEAEDFVDYLISVERLDDAAVLLGKIVNDNDFVSKKGKSNHTLWHELCKLISKNPKKISSLNVDAVSFILISILVRLFCRIQIELYDHYSNQYLFFGISSFNKFFDYYYICILSKVF